MKSFSQYNKTSIELSVYYMPHYKRFWITYVTKTQTKQKHLVDHEHKWNVKGNFEITVLYIAWESSRYFCDFTTTAEIPYWWRDTAQIWVGILIDWKFALPIRGNTHFLVVTRLTSVWSFYIRFSDVTLWGLQWWRRKMSAIFSGYSIQSQRHFLPARCGLCEKKVSK